jgi:hypothetical protein
MIEFFETVAYFLLFINKLATTAATITSREAVTPIATATVSPKAVTARKKRNTCTAERAATHEKCHPCREALTNHCCEDSGRIW